MLTRRRRLIGVSCRGRFNFPPPLLVRGIGQVTSNIWTSFIVVLPRSLLRELDNEAAAEATMAGANC